MFQLEDDGEDEISDRVALLPPPSSPRPCGDRTHQATTPAAADRAICLTFLVILHLDLMEDPPGRDGQADIYDLRWRTGATRPPRPHRQQSTTTDDATTMMSTMAAAASDVDDDPPISAIPVAIPNSNKRKMTYKKDTVSNYNMQLRSVHKSNIVELGMAKE